jgi:ABC-type polysaccharide/polyol phosphate transport system ATPase subunit
MFLRLAFALFANLEPDAYIVDESLAVGDVFFQQRCFRRFQELRDGGCTILLVSHDMEAITHLVRPSHPAQRRQGGRRG